MSTQNLFHTIVVYSKPSIKKKKKKWYLLSRVRFIKSRDQTNMIKIRSILIDF